MRDISILAACACFVLACGTEASTPSPTTDDKAPPPSEASEPAPEAEPPPPPEPPAFVWHAALTVPEGRDFIGLPLTADGENLFLEADKKLVVVPRAGGEPKTVALGTWMTPFAMRGDELFLSGDYAVHVLGKDLAGSPSKRFETKGMVDPNVVGEHMVLLSYGDGSHALNHAPLAGGEFTRIELGGKLRSNQPTAVRGDAMLLVLDWAKVVRVGGELAAVETVFELSAEQSNAYIQDATFAGDTILLSIGDSETGKLSLVRRAADGSQTTLQETDAAHLSSLVGDGELAIWQVQDVGAWLVDHATIQPVDLGGYTKHIAATPAGLVWRIDNEIRLMGQGPAAPIALASDLLPKDQLAGFGGPSISGKSVVIGALDADYVRRIIRAHSTDVRKCSKKLGKTDAQLTVDFTIDAEGKVGGVTPRDAESFPNPDVVTCLSEALTGWTFPKPARGGSAKATHTFIF